MKKEYFEYRPNFIYMCFLPCLIIEDIVFLIVSYVSLQTRDYSLFGLFLFFLIVSGILTKQFYDQGRVIVILEEEKIHVFNDRQVANSCILWENLQYGYYCSNYKMHLFLILSKENIDENQIKVLVKKGQNYRKIHMDNVLVFELPFANKEKRLYIQEFISRKIPNIKEL